MNDADAVAGISQAKLEVKSSAVFMQVEEFRSIENRAPIGVDKFVRDELVLCLRGNSCGRLHRERPLNRSARLFVLSGAGRYIRGAD